MLGSHLCNNLCDGDTLVFLQRKHQRSGVFNVNKTKVDVPTTISEKITSIGDLNVLPVLLNNDIQVDVKDGVEHVSTYLLNSSYQFVEILTKESLLTLHPADMGVKFIVVHTTNVSALVSLYHGFNNTQLTDLSKAHGILPGSVKAVLLEDLLKHECTQSCKGQAIVLLFASRRRIQQGTLPARTVATVRETEKNRKAQRKVNEQIKAVENQRQSANISQDNSTTVSEYVNNRFPEICSLRRQHSIAQQWQSEMDPKLWIPRACTVCAKKTRSLALTLCNPLHYDLTLLRNPALPMETLPTTYNLEAYDGAILLSSALQDKTKKGPFEICDSCRISLEANQQPLDSLANFQYYARDELPPNIKTAFEEASLYDLMMIAHSRCTRITHLFSDKGQVTKPPDNKRAISQKYSKGNVAVFAQDIVSLRQLLPP
ncbi:hypothetical protein R3P38DRAFT_2515926, partial [Favolaschia claudopus]